MDHHSPDEVVICVEREQCEASCIVERDTHGRGTVTDQMDEATHHVQQLSFIVETHQ